MAPLLFTALHTVADLQVFQERLLRHAAIAANSVTPLILRRTSALHDPLKRVSLQIVVCHLSVLSCGEKLSVRYPAAVGKRMAFAGVLYAGAMDHFRNGRPIVVPAAFA